MINGISLLSNNSCITILFFVTSCTCGSLRAAEDSYLRYEGEFYVTNTKDKWEGSGFEGTSPPLPFTVIVGAKGQFRSYFDLKAMNKETNPFSAGFLKIDDFIYRYYTAKATRDKPADRPAGVGLISDKLANLDKYSEILYLAFNRSELKSWPGNMSDLTVFAGLQSYPDIKLRVNEINESASYEWQLWAKSNEPGASVSICIFRLNVNYDTSSRNVESVTFEHRVYDIVSSDAFFSTILTSYRFVVKGRSALDKFPLAALLDDSNANHVYILDKRPENGKQGLSYVLQANARGMHRDEQEKRLPILHGPAAHDGRSARAGTALVDGVGAVAVSGAVGARADADKALGTTRSTV